MISASPRPALCSFAVSLLALTLLLAPSSPAEADDYYDLGLRLQSSDPARATQALTMSQRLAAIDSLVALSDSPSTAPDSTLYRISALYAGSTLMKHRILALEPLDHVDDQQSIEWMTSKGLGFERTFNLWNARKLFDELARRYPDSSVAHRARGIFLMDDGLLTLDEKLLAESLGSFERAVRCPDAVYEDWLGLASALLANAKRPELRAVGEQMLSYGVDSPAPHLYAAVGLLAQELDYSAEKMFQKAIAVMPEDMQWRFQDEEARLSLSLGDQLGQSLLAELKPRGLLYWWDRLVENEVLFGDPAAQRHGWESYTGQVHLKLGRPHRHAYYPPFYQLSIEEVFAFNNLDRHREHIANALDDHDPEQGFWIWILRTHRAEFPFVFQQGGRYGHWTPTAHSNRQLGDFVEATKPMGLGLQWGEARRPLVTIEARHVAYAPRGDRTLVESYVSVSTEEGGDDPSRLRITILNENGDVIERSARELEDGLRREALLRQLHVAGAERRGFLVPFGADLLPGHYIVRIEAQDDEGELLAATDQGYDVRPLEDAFSLSDLLLCDSLTPLRAEQELPTGFVKYAYGVLPHPEHEVPAGQDEITVYYEVYGATLDERGETHLDVLYEIFDRRRFTALSAGDPFAKAKDTGIVQRAYFPNERTGRSHEGVVVKGTKLDLSDLEPGSYVAVITVSDRLTRSESQRLLRFRRAEKG